MDYSNATYQISQNSPSEPTETEIINKNTAMEIGKSTVKLYSVFNANKESPPDNKTGINPLSMNLSAGKVPVENTTVNAVTNLDRGDNRTSIFTGSGNDSDGCNWCNAIIGLVLVEIAGATLIVAIVIVKSKQKNFIVVLIQFSKLFCKFLI